MLSSLISGFVSASIYSNTLEIYLQEIFFFVFERAIEISLVMSSLVSRQNVFRRLNH
jgi:hypothetical protein